jgi:hypothetical protein
MCDRNLTENTPQIARHVVFQSFVRLVNTCKATVLVAVFDFQLALYYSKVALKLGYVKKLTADEQVRWWPSRYIAHSLLLNCVQHFLMMPMMHSEDHTDHAIMRAICSELHLDQICKDIDVHTAVLERFGRYPNRNQQLQRYSTVEEIEWMKTNSPFG